MKKEIIEDARAGLLLLSEGNSVYYILKAFKLLLSYRKSNSLSDLLNHPELLSYSENNLEKVGRILSTRDLRRTAWHFLDYGAATAFILQQRLEITEPTAYRYLKNLRAFNFIEPAIRYRGAKGKRGPKPDIWMVPDATNDHINEAQELHRRLMSPKFRVAKDVAQTILEDYITPRQVTEITYREIVIQVKELRIPFRAPDIADLAAQYLGEQGVKVWR